MATCNDVRVDFVLQLLASSLGSLFGEGVGRRMQGSNDRRLLANNKVRCEIAAFEGRVLNIGTEWSAGLCEISPGHLRFSPRIGIVGDREIDVQRLEPADPPPVRARQLEDFAYFRLSTANGDLRWAIPSRLAGLVVERLRTKVA